MSYYQFGTAWVKETVENGHLALRAYTAHPQTDSNAKLDDTTEFDGETRETSQRFREGTSWPRVTPTGEHGNRSDPQR